MNKGWDVKQTVAGSEPFKVFDGKMNDIEKAIEILMDIQSDWEDGEEYEAFNTALKALEKQIPEKPYYLNYGGCNVGNWNHGIACICDYKAPYCRYCGQKLDWEVETDE